MVCYAAGVVLLAALSLAPLRGVRLATNLMVVAVSIFIAGRSRGSIHHPLAPWSCSRPCRALGMSSRAAARHNWSTGTRRPWLSTLDLLQVVDGSSHRGDGREPADFYAWRQPVLAPAEGVVVTVSDVLPDQTIGTVDRIHPEGNYVVLQIGEGRYVCFGHLKSQSIRVTVGQRVHPGDMIGLVGNSGNSDEPHLHLQAQNSPVFDVLQAPRRTRHLSTADRGPHTQTGNSPPRAGAS